MKKFISSLLIIAGMMLAIPAQAQLIKFGVKGGYNLSKPKYQNTSASTTGKQYSGFFFGPTAEVKIPFLGLGVDGALMYSQKGVAVTSNKYATIKQQEIIIPVNLKYTIGSSLAGIFLFAGPQFAYNMSSNKNDGYRTYSFNKSNVSINAGLGFKLANHLQISANYNIPCNHTANYVVDNAEGQERWCKNKTWQFAAAWYF
jgi:hypothetical protein